MDEPPRTTADLYLRLSDLRPCDTCRASGTDCDHDSLVAKEKLLRNEARRLGWDIHRVVIENDALPPARNGNGKRRPASAFKRRKIVTPSGEVKYRVIRPGFRSILDDLVSGRANAILAEDLDRACRDPRDLEDLIDVAEAHRVNARSLSGSLTFTAGGTDSEITMARIMVAVGNKSSRDTARRVAQSRERRAMAGNNGGGRRPYGFVLDPAHRTKEDRGLIIDQAEAAVIRQAAEAVLSGPVSHLDRSDPALARQDEAVTLKAIARDLRKRGVPTVTGAAWTPDTLQAILVRPMNAGKAVYRGEVIEVPEDRQPEWMRHPILEPDLWEAVVARLTDPDRRTQTGNAPKWLGSGIYRCGVCEDGTTCIVSKSSGRAACPRYVCRAKGHLGRAVHLLDRYVEAHVVEVLAKPEAARLLAPAAPGIDAAALRAELKVHKARLTQIAKDADDDLITREQFLTQTASRRQKMAAIDKQLAASTTVDPLAGIAGHPDAADVWDGLTLEQKREVLRRTLTVTILPTGRGRGFREDGVRIEQVKRT